MSFRIRRKSPKTVCWLLSVGSFCRMFATGNRQQTTGRLLYQPVFGLRFPNLIWQGEFLVTWLLSLTHHSD